LHTAQQMPLTNSRRAVKRLCVCVCVCVIMQGFMSHDTTANSAFNNSEDN